MNIVFLIFALLKGSYSLFVAAVNCKNLLDKTVKLSDASNEKLSALIKYRATLLSYRDVWYMCYANFSNLRRSKYEVYDFRFCHLVCNRSN